jgi:hypothetical protein
MDAKKLIAERRKQLEAAEMTLAVAEANARGCRAALAEAEKLLKPTTTHELRAVS